MRSHILKGWKNSPTQRKSKTIWTLHRSYEKRPDVNQHVRIWNPACVVVVAKACQAPRQTKPLTAYSLRTCPLNSLISKNTNEGFSYSQSANRSVFSYSPKLGRGGGCGRSSAAVAQRPCGAAALVGAAACSPLALRRQLQLRQMP